MRRSVSLTVKAKADEIGTDLTDWKRFDADDVDSYDDDPEDAFDWTDAVIVRRPSKAALSIRLDDDVVAFFKAGGRGYQTRINAVLRAWMEAQKARSGG